MSELRRPAPSVVRLALAVLAVALGTILVLAGLAAMAGPRQPASLAVASVSPGATRGPATRATGMPPPAGPSASPDREPTPDPVLVGAGDIGRCDAADDEATAALAEGLPGTVFVLGDNAYERGLPREFRECYGPGWGRLIDRTRFAVAGNHDYGTREAIGHRNYFGSAASRDGVTWFSEDVGAWHVVVLDANCGELRRGCRPDSPQLRWLAGDLAASRARCTLALWHQPRFSSGDHGGDVAVAPFWDVLYGAGADLVVNGHEHDYERFAPQDPSGRRDRERGITQLIVGTGGAPLRDFGEPVANSVVRSSLAHGVIELTLHPAGWSYRFLSVDGSFSDQGTGSCH